MYDHNLHRRWKHFCHYYLQAFSSEEIWKLYIKDCFKINGKQKIIMPMKDEYVRKTITKLFERNKTKRRLHFMIYADFEL